MSIDGAFLILVPRVFSPPRSPQKREKALGTRWAFLTKVVFFRSMICHKTLWARCTTLFYQAGRSEMWVLFSTTTSVACCSCHPADISIYSPWMAPVVQWMVLSTWPTLLLLNTSSCRTPMVRWQVEECPFTTHTHCSFSSSAILKVCVKKGLDMTFPSCESKFKGV